MPGGLISAPVSLLAMAAAAIPLLATSSPTTADVYAVLGAILATFISLSEGHSRGRTFSHRMSVGLASAAVGAFTPGLLIFHFWPARSAVLTWHSWAALGFVFGLGGWALTHAVRRLFWERTGDVLSLLLDRLLGKSPPPSLPVRHTIAAEPFDSGAYKVE